jgi:hypothetical protein
MNCTRTLGRAPTLIKPLAANTIQNKEKAYQSRTGMPSTLSTASISNENSTGQVRYEPEEVKDMALVIHKPAQPAPPDNEPIENKVVIRTADAPRASKLRRSHRLVIQNVYHIYRIAQHSIT